MIIADGQYLRCSTCGRTVARGTTAAVAILAARAAELGIECAQCGMPSMSPENERELARGAAELKQFMLPWDSR